MPIFLPLLTSVVVFKLNFFPFGHFVSKEASILLDRTEKLAASINGIRPDGPLSNSWLPIA